MAAGAAPDGADPSAPNHEQEATQRVQVGGQRPVDQPPQPSTDLVKWTKAWWESTDAVPAFDRAVEAARFCRQTLIPSWWDAKDPWNGRTPAQLRRRKDDREVRIPTAYLQVQQTVAMLIPADHEARWQERRKVGAKLEPGKFTDRLLAAYAETIEVVVRHYAEEAGIQAKLEAYVRDGLTFPLAVLKVYFSRGWTQDPLGLISSEDASDTVERIRVLAEDALRGEIHEGDPEWIELESLSRGLSEEASLTMLRQLVVEVLPPTAFRFSAKVKSSDQIMAAPWMAHDIEMGAEELREHFPFRELADGAWEGLHPDDADRLCHGEDGADHLRASDEHPGRNRKRHSRVQAGEDSQPAKSILVREVWDRQTGEVVVLVKGLDYPVRRWTPKRTPRQFYPFYPLVFNEVPHSSYGISDVEMLADIQARMNRKRSDEEKARWNSLPRGAYDTSMGDDKEAIKLQDIQPGQAIGMNLGGKKINEMIQWWQWDYNPESFATGKDEQDARMVGNLPEQALGVTGRAKFAAEVQTAAAGAQIASDARKRRMQQALARIYDGIAQILMQELSLSEVQDIAGPEAVWPKVWGEAEAKRAAEQIKGTIRQQAMPQAMMQVQQQVMAGQLPPDMAEGRAAELIEQQTAAAVQDAMVQAFGHTEPLTREALYRRLSCVVRIDQDPALAREARMQGTAQLMQAVAGIIAAARESGMQVDVEALMVRFLKMAGQDDGMLDGVFSPDPSQLAAQVMAMIQQDPQSVDPQVLAALLQVLAPMAQQLQQVAMQQQQAGPGQQPAPA